MGLFSTLFGDKSGARKELKNAQKDAQASLDAARTEARNQLTGATGQAIGTLGSGYDSAIDTSNQGYDTSLAALAQGLNDSTQTLRDAETSTTNYVNQGAGAARTAYGNANDAIAAALEAGRNLSQPYVDAGTKANGLYETALGLTGSPEDAAAFYENYAANDPFREFNADLANKAIIAAQNKAGMKTSGRTDLALSRANLERGSTDLNSYLDRLNNVATRGQSAAENLASREQNAGSQTAGVFGNIANLETSTGNSLADIATNTGNNVAGLQTGFGKDSADLSTNHANQVSGLEVNKGTGISNLQLGQGNALASIALGAGDQDAARRIGLGNALADSKANSGILNSLASAAGTLIGASTGLSSIGSGIKSLTGNTYTGSLVP